jgi:hypothetical protein
MSPEAVMRMPFKRFTACQRHAFRQSVEARNRKLAERAAEEA